MSPQLSWQKLLKFPALPKLMLDPAQAQLLPLIKQRGFRYNLSYFVAT